MPQVFRTMLEVDGQPILENSTRGLGVRIAIDINVSTDGLVFPRTGGMSVAPGWRQLPYYRIPKRLGGTANDACGSNRLRCWRFGKGPFEDALITESLSLRVDSEVHGVIEPTEEMSIEAYQQSLVQTREHLLVDEN